MISRFLTIIGISVLASVATAQSANCVKSMSLAPYPYAINKFSSGSGRCINDSSVSSSFSSASLPDANGVHSALNQKCNAIVGGCAPKPPPVQTYNYSIRAKYLSASGSDNLISISLASTSLDPYQCVNVTTNYSAVLDKNIPENALFLSKYSVAQQPWLQVYLSCTSPVVSQTINNSNGIPTYNKTYSGCKVTSSSLSSAPSSTIYCY